MITNGPGWAEREVELLTILRSCCTDKEISKVLIGLGFNRSVEAVSRKSRRMQIKFHSLGEPIGDLSEQESSIVDLVLSEREVPGYLAPLFESIAGVEASDPWENWNPSTPENYEILDPSVKWISGAIPLHKDRVSKFIMLNDIHVPHNVPLSGIWDFVRDFKPDYMLLVGDIVNNDPFSHWDREKPAKAKKMPQPKAYFKLCNDIFYNPMREAVGPECQVGHWIGNHEYWSNRAIDYMPEGEGYWEVWNNVDPGVVDFWVPSKGMANLGHIHFTHGDVIRGGKYHPSQFLQYFHRNVRYGHYHDVGTASHTAPIDMTDRHIARCNGCLEQYNPGFMEGRPHNWQHAFTYGYVKPDGVFNDYQVIIFDNKFYVNGKQYEGKK